MRLLFLGGALGAVLGFLLRNRDVVRGMLDQSPLDRMRATKLEDMTKDELIKALRSAS
jgi:hypothetical protein